MAAITEQQLDNAGRDADDLGAIVNDAADRVNPGHPDGTVTTRIGGDKPTVAKVLAQILSSTRALAVTWADLADADGDYADRRIGTGAEVLASDTGTHVDPVTNAQVANGGTYVRRAAGWQRVGDTDVVSARGYSAAMLALLQQSGADLGYAKALRSIFRETIEPGVHIEGLQISADQLSGETRMQLAFLQAIRNGAIREITQPGFVIAYGDGELATLNGDGLRVRLASATVEADNFSPQGVRDLAERAGGEYARAIPGRLKQAAVGGRQQIQLLDGGGNLTTLSDGTANDWLEGRAGSVISISSDRNDGTEQAIERAYTMSGDGKTVIRQGQNRRAMIFVGMGESLMDGGVGGDMPQAGPRFPGTVMMSNGGVRLDNPDSTATVITDDEITSLSALVEAGKQTFMGPLGWRIWQQHGIHSSHINVGVSGTSITAMYEGTNPFENARRALTAHIKFWRSHGYEPEVVLIIGTGVNDSGFGGSYLDIQPNVRAVRDAFRDQARLALGDPDAVIPMFYWTPISVGGTATGSWVAGGLAEMRREEHTHFVGPLTGIPYSDANHPTGLGQVIMGDSLIYRAIRRVLIDGQPWVDLRPIAGSAVRAGASASFRLEGFTGAPVYLADAWSPALPNWGIRVFKADGTEVNVTNVALDNGVVGKVNLTLASDPGPNAIITGALSPFGASNAPADKARTNIADQDLLQSAYDGRAFPKRLGQFRILAA